MSKIKSESWGLTRRELVEQAVRAAASPGAALFLSAFFSTRLGYTQGHSHQSAGAAPPQSDLLLNYQPRFFSANDFQALEAFTELLIPSDDTPGAREACCASYIDFVLQSSSKAQQTKWRKSMDLLKATGFYTAKQSDRLAVVTEISRPEIDPHASHPAYIAYRLIKQQTAFAFYTSRKGMIETLDYRGNSYNIVFPGCTHPQHQSVDHS